MKTLPELESQVIITGQEDLGPGEVVGLLKGGRVLVKHGTDERNVELEKVEQAP